MLAITGTITSHLTKMNGRQRVTIKDVSRAAGMSTKTVSRVGNNQGEINEATQVQVQAAIQQIAHRPNILARSLIHHRSIQHQHTG